MNNQNMIETVTRISGVNPRKCMRCGKCSGACPAYDEMPAKLIEAVRNAVQRQQGMDHLKPERIPEILDEELPQQAIAAAFRKYKK